MPDCRYACRRCGTRTPFGIETGLHYPVPLNRQPCLARLAGAPATYPVAEQWAREGLSLPLFNGMTAEQANATIAAVRRFFEQG